LVLVAVVGMLVVFVPPIARRVRTGRARELRLPVVATAAAFLPTLVLAVVHERYMADLTPLFAVTGIVGLYALAAVVRERPGWRRAGTVIIVVLLIVNVWTNVALTIEFRNHNQQLLAPHG
jgi:hypothetical protein